MMDKYLTKQINLECLQPETECGEHWKHSCKIRKSETHCEQNQQLEDMVKREKKLIKMMAAKLRSQSNQSSMIL